MCGRPMSPDVEWPDMWSPTLDHIEPVAEGGEHTAESLQAAHWICNVRKGDAWGPGEAQPS
ncbi:HNH endonuclease [Streptomyces sp. NPDC088785]|uniref:HNH endonuclease n=1 Tax=Streptomyces sp. NPDC088785 TaxID=3365897 RepID=UPI00380DA4AC